MLKATRMKAMVITLRTASSHDIVPCCMRCQVKGVCVMCHVTARLQL